MFKELEASDSITVAPVKGYFARDCRQHPRRGRNPANRQPRSREGRSCAADTLKTGVTYPSQPTVTANPVSANCGFWALRGRLKLRIYSNVRANPDGENRPENACQYRANFGFASSSLATHQSVEGSLGCPPHPNYKHIQVARWDACFAARPSATTC